MKILVTGSTGFVGTYVINELLGRNYEIIATAPDISKAMKYDWFAKVRFINYSFDLFEDKRDLYEYFERPDKLIHLAWQGLPNYKALFHIDKNLFSQYYFIKNLVENGLKDITITGTCLEYGMQSGLLKEDLVPAPANPYALAKDCLRRFVEELQKDYVFSFKWLRLFYMFGKGQNPRSLIPLLQQAIDNNEEEFKMSGGDQIRDYLSIEEVARFVVLSSMQSSITGIINCCSGRPISVKQFVNEYIASTNSKIKLNLGFYPYNDYEPMAFWGDNSKLNKILEKL